MTGIAKLALQVNTVVSSAELRRCPDCEGLLPRAAFVERSGLCRSCAKRRREIDTVPYATYAGVTRQHAMVNLIAAIREQAETDERNGIVLEQDAPFGGPLSAWRRNWVEDSQWARFWYMLTAP